MRSPFQGCLTALPTPFSSPRAVDPLLPASSLAALSSPIDYDALRELIERQIREGVDGLVVSGTTGEAATLSEAERQSLFAFTVGVVGGRVPVLAGVGTNATRSTVDMALRATDAGADGLMIVTPYYNRPSQSGMARHIETVARNVRLPIVLYNVPARTSVDLEPETTVALAQSLSNIVAIKEATNPARIARLAEHGALDLLCGEDEWILDGIANGACGAISVVSNLMPAAVRDMVRAAREGDEARALGHAETIVPLARSLFLETNPAPLKQALALLGLVRNELRLPLVPVGTASRDALRAALVAAGFHLG